MEHTIIRALAMVGGLVIAAAPAAAQNGPEKIGEVSVSVDENITEFGRLHVAAALLGWQISAPDGGPVSTLGVFYELQSRLWVHGHATAPLLGVIGGETPPYRLEAGILFFVKDRFEVEEEEVILSQTVATRERGGEKTFVNVPMINRNRGGLDASLMVAHGTEKFTEADGVGNMTSTSTALTLAVGLGAVGSTGFKVNVEKHGKRSNYRWNAGGLDALIDITRSYDTDPPAKGSRFGGRLWAETLWFRSLGMSARAEIGKYPGHAGWVLVFGLGGSLHL